MSVNRPQGEQFLAIHPVLGTEDVRRSIEFFRALGFSLIFLDDPANPKYACLQRDGVEVHTQWNEGARAGEKEDRPVYRFFVADVDGLYQELLNRAPHILAAGNSTPWAAPANTPWGTREFHMRDPGGNGLHFYQTRSAAPPGDGEQ